MFYKAFNCFRKAFSYRRVLDVFQRRFTGFLESFFKERDLRAVSIFTNHSKHFLTHFIQLISFDTPQKHFFSVFRSFQGVSEEISGMKWVNDCY